MARIVKSDLTMCSIALILMALIISQDVVIADVSCSDAVAKLSPCLPFLQDSGGITAPCCQGAQALNAMADTKPVRKSVCECLKQAAKTLKIDVAKAKQIPQLCSIKLTIPVDPNANCDNAFWPWGMMHA